MWETSQPLLTRHPATWDASEALLKMRWQPVCLLLSVAFLQTCLGITSHTDVYIKSVNLEIYPTSPVRSGTDVTLTCRADIRLIPLNLMKTEYIFFRNGDRLFRNETENMQMIFVIPSARLAQSGTYTCEVNAGGTRRESNEQSLIVEGLQTPALHLSKTRVSEGEQLSATCSAHMESASEFYFYFYEDMKQGQLKKSKSNKVEVQLKLEPEQRKLIHCKYLIIMPPYTVWSNESNKVAVDVHELTVKPRISVWPDTSVVEGDLLNITCDARGDIPNITVYLSNDEWMVRKEDSVTKALTARAKDSGVYTCELQINAMQKSVTSNISVTELFSKPVLTMKPPAVFENEQFTLTCSCKAIAENKIKHSDVTYTFHRGNETLQSTSYGELVMTAQPSLNGNYSCHAEVKGIHKQSVQLVFRAKELVSDPEIHIDGAVILEKSFIVRCHCQRGDLPIQYTLLKGQESMTNMTVHLSSRTATFKISLQKAEKNLGFTCQAENNGFYSRKWSRVLPVEVIVPPSKPQMINIPGVTEGGEMMLICNIKSDSFPLNFSWYRVGDEKPIHTNANVRVNHSLYSLTPAHREHSGEYYCEAANKAATVRSDPVHIEVKMAYWKIGLIVVVCLLLLAAIGILVFMWHRNRQGRAQMATELSVKPSSPKSDDSVRVSLIHDVGIYNPRRANADIAESSAWMKSTSCSGSEQNEEDSASEVEYTEVVHPQRAEPPRAPLRKGTDTVYSELQNSSQGAENCTDCEDAVEYARLNSDDAEPA